MTDRSGNSSKWYMTTVVGKDQPGIVAALTRALFDAGCHLGEASMNRLGGNFTIMMMVRSKADIGTLQDTVQPVATEWGLHVHIDAIDAQLHRHLVPDVQITLYGADRAGIVASATRALAAAGLNILDLNSDVGGSEARPVYIMMIDGFAAQGIGPLEQALAELRREGIEASLTSIDTLVG